MRNTSTWLMAIYVVVVLFIASGWGLNLYKVFKANYEAPYKNEVVRLIGVFGPPGKVS